jgi:hypothetical protein
MSNEKTPPQKPGINTESTENLVVASELLLMNLPPEVIATTADKVRLCLTVNLNKIEKKQRWITPLSILIVILVALISSNFKDMGFDASTWKAIFIIAGIGSFGWLLYSLKEAFCSVKIEDIINELKKDSESMVKFIQSK